MATYQEIKGRTVQTLSSDPPAAAGAGQIWYNNSAPAAFKTSIGVGAWTSGATLGTGGYLRRGLGLQTAGLLVGGELTGGLTYTNAVEEYNGSAWTAATGNLNTARMSAACCGTVGAAFAAGGEAPAETDSAEEYNGTSWTAVTSLPAAFGAMGGFGTQTAAVAAGGTNAPGAYVKTVHLWDGGAWTAGNSLLTNHAYASTTAASPGASGILSQGNTPPGTNATENYNGISWTVGGIRSYSAIASAGAGANENEALAWGGYPLPGGGQSSISESYDGSTWTTTSALGTAIRGQGGLGTTAGALSCSGAPPGTPYAPNTGTEQWDLTATVETITST